MKKIIILLDSLKGHITHVITSDPALDVRIVDIDIDSQDPVVGPYDPQVTVVVADVDVAAREQIREKVHGYEPEENGLEFQEASGGRQGSESVPDEQIILTLSNGYTLRSGGQKYELGAYARICDEHGQEKVYWSAEEWQDAPEEVMGAIFGAILHPEKFAALTPDQFPLKYSDAKGDGDKEEEAEFEENNNGIQETLL